MFRAAFLLLLALPLAAAGCASGQSVVPRNGDGGIDGSSADAAIAPLDGAVCDPACTTGQTCVAGVCQSGTVDNDHDGIPAGMDCDDTTASVGRTSERSCTSACGTGVERCNDGIWAACTASSSCDCTTGEPPRMIACTRCGMQQQICTSGMWADDGLCSGSGPCAPGDMDVADGCGTTTCGHQTRICQADCTWGAWSCMGEGVCVAGTIDSAMQACGTCGTGMQTRMRTCDSTTCQWGDYGAWSACSGGDTGVCTPGQMDSDTEPCGRCNSGTHTRTRTCDVTAGCAWGAWGAFGACSGESGCTPGATQTGSCGDCDVQTCTSSCTWGGCGLAPGNTCSTPGTGWQCCGAHGYQFCGSSSAACGRCHWCPCSVPAPSGYGC